MLGHICSVIRGATVYGVVVEPSFGLDFRLLRCWVAKGGCEGDSTKVNWRTFLVESSCRASYLLVIIFGSPREINSWSIAWSWNQSFGEFASCDQLIDAFFCGGFADVEVLDHEGDEFFFPDVAGFWDEIKDILGGGFFFFDGFGLADFLWGGGPPPDGVLLPSDKLFELGVSIVVLPPDALSPLWGHETEDVRESSWLQDEDATHGIGEIGVACGGVLPINR